MNKFIWVRDRDKVEHYVNTDHIIRVTKVPQSSSFTAYAYVTLVDGKMLDLSKDTFDTYEDVINKIQVALA